MKPWLKYSLIGAAGLVVVGFFAVSAYVLMVTRGLPSYASLANYEPPVTTRVYAGDGTLIGEYARERRLFVPIESIPRLVREAFLSAEDKNFYSHSGIDYFGILRASINNIFNLAEGRRLQGASTITQQVAKNFLLNSDVKMSRKVREAVLAMRIDSAFSKDKVLELYLNEIFLGQNSYGVAAAASNYFNKSLDELTPAEAAFLAALPKGPANYDPVRRKAAAIARRNWVLGQMADNGYITRDEARTGQAEDLVTQTRALGAVAPDVDYFVEEVRRFLYDKYGADALYDGGLQVRTTLQPRLQEIAVRSLRNGLVTYDRRHGYRGAFGKIDFNGADAATWRDKLAGTPNNSGVATWRVAMVSVLNPDAATIAFGDGTKGRLPLSELTWARKTVGEYLGPEIKKPADALHLGDLIYVEPVVKAGKATGDWGLRQVPSINGAVVAIDPHTGDVLALSGGFSYGSSEFDRATQAKRQVGSTFKPFVYATALDRGYSPVSKILDAPFAVEQGVGLPLWTPGNYEEGEYSGLMTLRRGIELSLNVMTARLAYEIGMEPVVDTAERMGVYDKLPPLLAMSLGAGETTLLRLTTGYAEFDNGGRKLEASLVDRIQDRHGKTVFRFDRRACEMCNVPDWKGQDEPLLDENKPQVLDPRTAYQIVSLLEGVVQRGTGAIIGATVKKPLAGKTGTTSDFKDTWFVGFSPDLAFGVFVGYDQPRSLGKGEAGAATAAPIFRDFMQEALVDVPATPFRIPSGIILVPVDSHTGAPVPQGTPGSILEAFKPGTEPGSEGYNPGDSGPIASETSTGVAAAAATGNEAAPATQISRGTGGLY